jgi:ABC-2 type transport system permease protein
MRKTEKAVKLEQAISTICKAWLFIKRGFLSMVSYRVALLIGLLSSFVGILQFGFMARFISQGDNPPLLAQYGGNLLAYLIIGSAFTGFVGVSLNSFQGAIRGEQQMGTLEYLLMSDTPLGAILLYSALWNFLYTLMNTAILFLFVTVLFDVSLSINLPAAGFILFLTVLSLSGVGLMSAGMIMVTKQGDPINWIFTTLTGLLSGVLFPVEMLPSYLQVISHVLPTTHALKALRLTLIQGVSLSSVMPEIAFLIITSCFTIPLGLFAFNLGFNKARRTGSLGEY